MKSTRLQLRALEHAVMQACDQLPILHRVAVLALVQSFVVILEDLISEVERLKAAK